MYHIIEFTKASGAGNDFVLIDNMDGKLDVDKAKLAVAVCSRHFGVGADGLLLLEPSDQADFFMRYYNADGSYGGMCGNGGRCVARYAYLQEIARSPMRFMALDHIYEAEVIGQGVRLKMKDPFDIRQAKTIQIENQKQDVCFVNTGSPHAVIITDAINNIDVETLGRQIRYHEAFAPDGANVDFMSLSGPSRIEMRTYERGVERETLACGTGAVASAAIAAIKHAFPSPISVKTRSGEELVVHFHSSSTKISDVFLQGSAHLLFTGKFSYDDATGALVDIEEEPSHQFPSSSR
jgi:diaminopimelate epimerase